MSRAANELVWSGARGHYEVYYLTLTDPFTGVGLWIRYTMLAPLAPAEPVTASVWFLAMDPRPGHVPTFGRKETWPIERLSATRDPFQLTVADCVLTDTRMAGALSGASWDLSFARSRLAYQHVHPALRAARAAQTILTLPQADLAISGHVEFGDQRLEVTDARGGQAHLWGTKHAQTWAWVHCNDFIRDDGNRAADTILDAVSVMVRRLGREVGPSTPVVGHVGGEDFVSTSPWRVLSNPSQFALTGWRFEATSARRKLIAEIDADRDQLAGVTYQDPDGEKAYCYNTETASLRLQVLARSQHVGGWALSETLVAPGRAHFEYAQREPVPGIALLTT